MVLAAEWLRRPGPVRVTEVAHGVGFKDSSHFARMFRARYGVSPGRWRLAQEGVRNDDGFSASRAR